jgi:hypothetical protein
MADPVRCVASGIAADCQGQRQEITRENGASGVAAGPNPIE